MILTRLFAGLGNQLFQYAAGRGVAARLGVELILDSSRLDGEDRARPNARRMYQLGCFDHGLRVERASRVARLPPMNRLQFYSRRIAPRWIKPDVRKLVEANVFEVDERVFTAGDNTYLIGYWVSERYFAEHADVIRSELRFRPLPPSAVGLAREIRERRAVSLHVRRGDKASAPSELTPWRLLPSTWYLAALSELERRVGPIETVYVFSDDPAWCRSNLELPVQTVFVEGNPGPLDLQLMSLCRHHIIANSTFSWWGAWLNPSVEKVVVAPSRWWNGEPTVDVVPPGWVQVAN
jgi:hypothetical protein